MDFWFGFIWLGEEEGELNDCYAKPPSAALLRNPGGIFTRIRGAAVQSKMVMTHLW